MTAVIYCICS